MNFEWSQVVQPNSERVSIETIDRFEKSVGFAFPDDYRQFMLEFNGGKVTVEHDIHVPDFSCDVYVTDFLPLTKECPSLGIREAREIQEGSRLCLRQMIRIADDFGTGFFYLLLSGEQAGAVYFAFKDELPILEGDWYSDQIVIPESVVKVSSSFNALGQAILENRID